ncbi:MAG TPA: ion channel [bacterium]|nr:ion channel [bacterium]
MRKPSRKNEILSKAAHPGRWGEGRLIWLLAVLVGLMVAYPFFVHRPAVISVFNLFQTAALLLVIFAVCRKKSEFIPLAAVFSLFAGLSWLDILYLKNPALVFVIIPGWAVFYGFAIVAVLSRVSRYRRITFDEVAGAVSAYILIGLFFSMLYLWIELLQPGSFHISEQTNLNNLVDYSDFVLFSFATLTTLGYGDITPLTHITQVVAVLESIIGVLYVAVLVGGLVGMVISERLEQKRHEREGGDEPDGDRHDNRP